MALYTSPEFFGEPSVLFFESYLYAVVFSFLLADAACFAPSQIFPAKRPHQLTARAIACKDSQNLTPLLNPHPCSSRWKTRTTWPTCDLSCSLKCDVPAWRLSQDSRISSYVHCGMPTRWPEDQAHENNSASPDLFSEVGFRKGWLSITRRFSPPHKRRGKLSSHIYCHWIKICM